MINEKQKFSIYNNGNSQKPESSRTKEMVEYWERMQKIYQNEWAAIPNDQFHRTQKHAARTRLKDAERQLTGHQKELAKVN